MSAPALTSFTTRSGASVDVVTTGLSGYPYRWTCAADQDHYSRGQKSLPLTRRDAEDHADTCQTGGAL